MYNFKEFFTKNFDYPILMEARAYRGTYDKSPTQIDEEDLDFLYQIDQNYWATALQQRIQKTWHFLKARQNIRNKISSEILNSFKEKFGLSSKAYQRKSSKIKNNFTIDQSNIGEFKNFILDLASKYDNYGERSSGAINRQELSDWFDKLLDSYDFQSPTSRTSKENYKTIRILIHEITKHIVTYVKGGDQETYSVGDKKIKFYINRYIEKLETLPGDEHTIKTKLEHLSQVYGKDIEFETHGKHGIDLSNPTKSKTTTKDKKGEERTEVIYKVGSGDDGFNFPKMSGIKTALKNLYALNYHRHFGHLPSDVEDRDVTYQIVRSGINPKYRPEIDDTEIQNTVQRNIQNFILKFIDNNKGLGGDRPYTTAQFIDFRKSSPAPVKELREMESGLWLIKFLLKDQNASEKDISRVSEDDFRSIFHNNYEEVVEKNKVDGKINAQTLEHMTTWRHIAKNTKLKKIFAKYFSEQRTKEIIRQEAVHGPKILSVDITGDPVKDEEIRKRELDKLNEKDREKLKAILGRDWESFQRTGRIPYKIKGDKLRVGSGKTKNKKGEIVEGDKPKIILPYVKIGEGENARSVPLLNAPSFIRSSTPKESKEIIDLRKEITANLVSVGVDLESIDLQSSDDLNKLLDKNEIDNSTKDLIKELIDLMGENLEADLMTTPRGGVIMGKDEEGKTTETLLNKFYRTRKYKHGAVGTRLVGWRPEVKSQIPGSIHEKSTKVALAKIFPRNSTVMGSSSGELIGKELWSYFEKHPEYYPDNARPMILKTYRIVEKSKAELKENKTFDLSMFQLIKESDEDESYDDDYSDDGDGDDYDTSSAIPGAKQIKTTSKFDGKSTLSDFYEIREVEDGSGDISGWSDIVVGMKDSFLGKKFGAGEANKTDILKGLKIKFEDLHARIVDLFYANAKDKDLHYALGRRTRAANYISTLLQKSAEGREKQGEETLDKDSESRKTRTDTEGLFKARNTVVIEDDLSKIKPLTIDKNSSKLEKYQFISIFADTSKKISFRSSSGADITLDMLNPDPDAPQGQRVTFVFRSPADLAKRLYDKSASIGTSHILKYMFENSDKISSSNYNFIFEVLNKEKTNLLDYWQRLFNNIKNAYKSRGVSGSDFEKYFNDNPIKEKINDVYEDAKERLKYFAQSSVESLKASEESPINAGCNRMLAIIKNIEDILEDEDYKGPIKLYNKYQNYRIPSNESSESVIYHWASYWRSLAGALGRENIIIDILLKHLGGISDVGQRLHNQEVSMKKDQLRKKGVVPSDDAAVLSKQLKDNKIPPISTIPLKGVSPKFLNEISANIDELAKLWPPSWTKNDPDINRFRETIAGASRLTDREVKADIEKLTKAVMARKPIMDLIKSTFINAAKANQ